MHCRSDCGKTFWSAPSIGFRRTIMPSFSREHSVPVWPNYFAACSEKAFSSCTLKKPVEIGGLRASYFGLRWITVLGKFSNTWHGRSSRSLWTILIFVTRRSSSSGVLQVPSDEKRDIASAAWCLKPARWTTSKFNWKMQSRHLARLSHALVRFTTHQSDFWSVRLVNLHLPR